MLRYLSKTIQITNSGIFNNVNPFMLITYYINVLNDQVSIEEHMVKDLYSVIGSWLNTERMQTMKL